MSSPASNKHAATAACAGVAALWLAGCASEPPHHLPPPPAPRPAPVVAPPVVRPAPAPPVVSTAPAPAAQPAGRPAGATPVTPAAAVAVVHPDVPPGARADFQRAVNFVRAGNATEAELGFKQVALQYPQFAAPLVNLALLQRKQDHLEEAERTLKNAVARENGSAVAWTELGITQRMRGEFKESAASYEQAIAADARYAPAWRNLGVLSDLYLGDPKRALAAFEQYKQLSGEDKPVSGWIAELRQRLGLKRPTAPADGGAAPPDSPTPSAAPGPAATPAEPARPAPQSAAGTEPRNSAA